MNNDCDRLLLHSDLSALEKLGNFSFESKMLASQIYSSRIMNSSEVDMHLAYKENIMPWEIEIFTAYSVIYNFDNTVKEIDSKSFADAITYIRNYWDDAWNELKHSGTYAEAFMIRTAVQQFPVQGVFLQKLFRYNYFFNFVNDRVDMKSEFISKFSTNYRDFEITAFIVFLTFSRGIDKGIEDQQIHSLLKKAFQNKEVMSVLRIEKEDNIINISDLYHGDMIKLFYGLKAHYWWPLISGTDFTYVPAPYLIVNAVTDSMLNRLTLGNKKLRNLIGKEVIENYLYNIYEQVETVTWISHEIEYKVKKNSYRTPDVLVGEKDYCTFYDTKEMVPSLKIRELDTKEIQKDTEIYAEAIIQIYHQIINYIKGYFELDKLYNKEHLFGVVVMLDDIALSRRKMYDRVFELYQQRLESLDIVEQRYIHSHIKVVSLRQVESKVLQNVSFLPCIFQQEKHPEMWDDLNFVSPSLENGLIPIYNDYVANIKKEILSMEKTP